MKIISQFWKPYYPGTFYHDAPYLSYCCYQDVWWIFYTTLLRFFRIASHQLGGLLLPFMHLISILHYGRGWTLQLARRDLLRYTLFIYHILIYINYILHTLYITYLYTLIIYYILYANKKTTSSPRKRTCQKQDKRKALPFLAALLFNSLIKSLRKGKALLSSKF